jgi:hypothetical protein
MVTLLLVKQTGVIVWIGFFWLKVCLTVINVTSGSRKARGFLEPFRGVSVSFRRELWSCLVLVILQCGVLLGGNFAGSQWRAGGLLFESRCWHFFVS